MRQKVDKWSSGLRVGGKAEDGEYLLLASCASFSARLTERMLLGREGKNTMCLNICVSCTFSVFQVLPFPSQVVYNRVGKCGSRTVVLLLRILSEKHGFNLVTSDIHNKTRLTKNEQVIPLSHP